MEKYKKRELLQSVNSLLKANETINKAVKNNPKGVIEALASCQESALVLGTYIDTLGEKYAYLVRILEEYCETLYQMSIQISDENQSRKLSKKIQKQLLQLKDGIRYNFPEEKKEVVFLPYKASMWDSLESIWKAAEADENCNTLVIPIPFFERNSDGTVGDMHYEGHNLPEYVPITDWRSYNFQQEMPDIVYIHNPYDNTNLVTVVHPDFFSHEIKKYTQILVYCPYFYTGGYLSESHSMLSAYVHVDFIITQSAHMKKYFDQRIRKKLLPLGSPKVDRIFAYQHKKDLSKWGSHKDNRKYFLLNLSITSVLTHNEIQLKKIEYIIKCFEHLKDAVLVWRPHPLMENTLTAMRPELLDHYHAVMAKIEELDYVVIDENADITISVCRADAYIGEGSSSVVALFGVQGKPVLITAPGITEDYTSEAFVEAGYDCLKVGDEYWLAGGFGSYLYRLDDAFHVMGQYQIPDEMTDGNRLYNRMVCWDKKIILIPYNAKEIGVFHMDTGSFQKIRYENADRDKYVDAYVYSGKVFMIPSMGNYILELDVPRLSIKYHHCLNKINKMSDTSKPIFFNGTCVRGHFLYLFAAQTSQMVLFDMDSKKTETKNIQGLDDGVWAAAVMGERCYLASNEGSWVATWDFESDHVKKTEDFPEGFKGNSQCFISMVPCEREILIFPKKANQILSWNPDHKELSDKQYDLGYEEGERKSGYYNWPSNYYFARKLVGGQAVAMSACDNSLLLFDESGEILRRSQILSSRASMDVSRRFRKLTDNIPWACRESKRTTIPMFVKYVMAMSGVLEQEINGYRQVTCHMDGTSGQHIHEEIVGRLEREL